MSSRPMRCRITIRGRVTSYWSPWLGELQFSCRSDDEGRTVTDLTGTLPDQSALQGVLNRIWNLNLTVLGVSASAVDTREGEAAGSGG